MDFKIGDIVTPFDGSYSVGAGNEGFEHKHGTEMKDRKFKVLATGLKVPPMNFNKKFALNVITFKGKPAYNDLLIQAIDNGEYIFVMSDFVKVVPQPVSFMEAREAAIEGKRPTIELCGSKYTLFAEKGMYGEIGYWLKVESENGITYGISTGMIDGMWTIEE
jgi:hypothetical protein